MPAGRCYSVARSDRSRRSKWSNTFVHVDDDVASSACDSQSMPALRKPEPARRQPAERETVRMRSRRGSAPVNYPTDGVHLYEGLGWCQNFGLTGGGWLTVRDCRTGTIRKLCRLELALCEPVPRPQAGSA
jgi:hypothetical protein